MENNVNITPKLKHTPLNMTGLHLHHASTRSQGCTMQPNPITASFMHALKQSLPLSLMYIYTYVLTLPHPCCQNHTVRGCIIYSEQGVVWSCCQNCHHLYALLWGP